MSTPRSSIADNFALMAYKDILIDLELEDFSNWLHREASVKIDWLLNLYVNKLDEEILAEVPIFVPDIFGGQFDTQETEADDQNLPQEVDANVMTLAGTEPAEDVAPPAADVSQEWTDENFSGFFVKMFNKARSHSFCIVKLYPTAPYWRVFTPREILQIDYDDGDNPVHAKVRWTRNLPHATKWTQHEDEFDLTTKDRLTDAILVSYGDADGNDLGEYDFEHAWSLNVYLRYQALDIVLNSAKTSGWFWFRYGEAMTPAKETDLKTALDRASTSSGVGAKGSVLDNVTAVTPGKPEFTVMAFDQTLRMFASACRLPLSYFNAEVEQGGMFSLDSMDIVKINNKKKTIFGKFKKSIIKLIEMRWGIIVDDVFPNLEESEEENYKEEIIVPTQNDVGVDNNENKKKMEEISQNGGNGKISKRE